MPPGLTTFALRVWRLPLRLKLTLAAAAAALGMGGWLILRDTPLFSVDNVTIVGLSADAVPSVSEQLVAAARRQTTTDFSVGDVRSAVATYTLVRSVRAVTHFPHGVTLFVSERLPVARVAAGRQSVPVAADGSVVTGFSPSVHLASVRARVAPLDGRTRDRFVLVALRVLAAAPAPFLHRVAAVTHPHGSLTVYLHRGPRLIFGDADLPHAKWDAAAAVLAARASRGAIYIDLVLPWRPSAQVGDPATSLSAATVVGAPASATTALGATALQASG